MTSLSMQDVTSSDEERASPEEACSPVKTTVKVPSAGGGAAADRQRGRLGYPDCVYSHAAQIFQTNHVEKPLATRVIRYAPIVHTHPEDPPETVSGENSSTNTSTANTLWAYEMAFSTLKFQELLEGVLIDSYFYSSQQMPDDLMSLVVVMLYDLQDRKFQPREPMTVEGEEPVEEVRRVESSLFSFRTKLAASLARCRIKQNLLSIDDILPNSLRQKHRRKHTLPLCAWVNTLQISVEDVAETLRDVGFVQVGPHTRLEGSVFCTDVHCPDVLMFPQQAEEKLDATSLLRDHALILQEKSRSLVASVVGPLLEKGADILMVGCFSAETVAHVAVHASTNDARVHVCGLLARPAHKEALQSVLSAVGCKNVQFLSDQFNEVNEWDSRIQKVRVILLLPQCSASGLCSPVQHILSEGGDRELLWDLSQGTVSQSKLDSLVTKQMKDLRHALTFPKVSVVVYCTCSVYEEENELLVKRALENATVKPKQRPFRIMSTGLGGEEDKFFRLEETDSVEGCFICLLKRDQEPPEPETVQDILARAAAKGLLGGLLDLEPPDEVKQKKKKKEKRKAAAPAAPLPPLSPVQTDVSDTTRPRTDDSLRENLYEEYPTSNRVSVTTLKHNLNFPDEDSSCSSRSSIVPDEIYSTLDHALMALNHVNVLSDQDSTDFNTTTQETNDQKRKPKSHRRTRRTKSKSKSRSRTTKSHKSPSSRKTKLRKRRIRRHHQTPAATAHTLMPTPPTGTRPTDLKPKTSLKELQKLPRRRRAQQETSQEVVGSKPEALDVSGLIKVKQNVETHRQGVVRSVGVVLPPISARSRGRRVLSSGLSSNLLQSSISSSSTSSYLSSGLLLSTSRTVSRDSAQSGSRTWR